MSKLSLEDLKDVDSHHLEFAATELAEHRDSKVRRVGYTLVTVARKPVPSWLRLSYVLGKAEAGEFVYVVIWPAWVTEPDNSPTHRTVESEEEAKQVLLQALTRQMWSRLEGRSAERS